jgi:hypothetical protein
VISIDPRDEEHSLLLVLRRLTADPAVVVRVAAAGHAWWRQHATLAQALSGWQQALDDARRATPPARTAAWPAHLTADGTEQARRILAELHVSTDVLG